MVARPINRETAEPEGAAVALLHYLQDRPTWLATSHAAQREARTRFAPSRFGEELELLYRQLMRQRS